ncbi:MAG TPA: hypothetical protein VFS21_38760 [Roseiflexaceae bacterium]|nr:hypothetical protein [Roseiflexaceae bacterium]
MDYFTSTTPVPFGPISWVLLIAQGAALLGGLYLAFARGDTHPLRGPLLKRLGYAVAFVGLLGVLLGALRLGQVVPFTARAWSLVVVAFELALAFYALYYSRTVYPAQAAQLSTGRSSRRSVGQQSARPVLSANGSGSHKAVEISEPRIASGRRDARRDRKRRGR